MAARPGLQGALLQQQVNLILAQAKQQMLTELVQTVSRQVGPALGRASTKRYVQAYSLSMQRAYTQALIQAQKDGAERAKQIALRGVNEINRATIGATDAARRDNAEIRGIWQTYANTANDAILAEYLKAFGGRSYRTGDPSRKSGEVESFLRRGTVAQPLKTGLGVEVSLQDAVGDPRLPHIFRLNYGTQADPGRPNKAGAQPPVVRISMFEGSKVFEKVTVADRERAMGGYPGKGFGSAPSFRFVLDSVGAGARPAAVRLFSAGATGGISGPRPASGIAPSYFVEQGMAKAARTLPQQHRALLNRWKQRVDRIHGEG